jgi:large subunit ribosomal protein L15
MKLNELSNNKGAKKNKKRVGRGIGSGKGKTCGRGVKGQKSRSGVAIKGFEGGQTSIIKRLPKRGFNCPSSVKYEVVNVADIESWMMVHNFDSSVIITKEHLIHAGFIKNAKSLVKLLGGINKVKNKILIKADNYSASAKKVIEEVGGQAL